MDTGKMRAWMEEEQSYACPERDAGGGLYRYKILDGGFTADLPVDADGLVPGYPGLFRRFLPSPRASG